MPGTRPVLIAAGGTGGHVYPALAIAEVLRLRNVPVVWLGTRSGLEATAVPAAGFDVEWITVSGLRGKGALASLLAPLTLCRACYQSWRVFLRRKPVAVLGMGGFVSGPGCLLALLTRLPFCVHEQNSVAGMTNRHLAKFAKRVFTAFPGVLDKLAQHSQVGNPVRADIEGIEHPHTRLQGRDGPVRVLVVGGSHGAQALNEQLPLVFAKLSTPVEVWHQCGKTQNALCVAAYDAAGFKARIEPFVDDMAEAYAWADLAICRAGAMTVFELAAVGLASVLVPYPHAVDDHQTTNAAWLADVSAAVIQPQSAIDINELAERIDDLVGNRQKLVEMSVNARTRFMQGSAVQVADALQEYSSEA